MKRLPGRLGLLQNSLWGLAVLVSLTDTIARASSATPTTDEINVRIPASGASPVQKAKTPFGDFEFSFSFQQGGVQIDISGIPSDTVDSLRETTVEVAAPFKSGLFRTRIFQGERWKCIADEEHGKFLTKNNDDIATSQMKSSLKQVKDGRLQLWVALSRLVSPTTDELVVRLAFPKAAAVVFRLKLGTPYQLPPLFAEMLRQYQKIGPTVFVQEYNEFKFIRVKKDECGDMTLSEESFDEKYVTTLAFPSHDWRLATAHGWVFAEPIASYRRHGIGAVDFKEIGVRNLMYLGDTYERELTEVTTSPGKATAVFSLGDFSGCWGAGCGEPTNKREAHVTLAGGVLSTKIVRE